MTNLDDIKKLTEAMLLMEQAKLAKLTSEEAAIRADLHKIAQDVERVQTLSDQDLAMARSIGADAKWLIWVGQMRSERNTKLAQLREKKVRLGQQLARAYGRNEAVDQLATQQATLHRRETATKRQEEWLGTAIFSRNTSE